MSGHSRIERGDCGNQSANDGEPVNETKDEGSTNEKENRERSDETEGPSQELEPVRQVSPASNDDPTQASERNQRARKNDSLASGTSLHLATESGNRPTSPDGCILYCRLIILLTTSCSGIMRAFIQQKVEQTKSNVGEEYTLRKFLDDNKNSALYYRSPVTGKQRKKIDKVHENKLYTHPQGIDQWDLSLLVFVATDMCNLPHAIKMQFHVLRETRNRLFHFPNPTLPDKDYGYYIDTIKAAHDELLKLVDDEGIRQELAEAFTKAQQDNEGLTFKKCVVEIQHWVEVDRGREILDITDEGPDMMKTLVALVDGMKEQNAAPEVLDIVISIVVRNVGASEERFIIKELLTHLDPHRLPPDLATATTTTTSTPSTAATNTATATTTSPPSPLQNVGPAIEKAIKELLTNDREISDVQYGCKVRVKCHSYEGVKDLVFKTIHGEVTKVFREVESNFHLFPGCENAKLDVILTEDDYCSFITELSKKQRDTPIHRGVINYVVRGIKGAVTLGPDFFWIPVVFAFCAWVIFERTRN